MKQAWPAEPILITSTLLMAGPAGDAGSGGWITYYFLAFLSSFNVFNVIQFLTVRLLVHTNKNGCLHLPQTMKEIMKVSFQVHLYFVKIFP